MPDDLGTMLRELRGTMTQIELARRAGISHGFVGHIESGARGCSDETLDALSAALDVSDDQRRSLRAAAHAYRERVAELRAAERASISILAERLDVLVDRVDGLSVRTDELRGMVETLLSSERPPSKSRASGPR